MERVVDLLIEAQPDAIQLSPGQAPVLQGRHVAADPRSCFAPTSPTFTGAREQRASTSFPSCSSDRWRRAVLLDAACVVVNLLSLPGTVSSITSAFEMCLRFAPPATPSACR